MKKLVLVLTMVMVIFTSTLSYATENVNNNENAGKTVETSVTASGEELTPAAEKILGNNAKKEQKIAEYSKKYGNEAFAYTAYYLDIVQLYSIPICIIGIAIGAFNFFIIGEKKLEKREKGFGFITGFLCGLVFFQALPLIFALLVAGR